MVDKESEPKECCFNEGIYRKFIGLPVDSPGGSTETEDFRSGGLVEFFKQHISFSKGSGGDTHSRLRILSIGTGYGRLDIPFIKAYIETAEENGIKKFQIVTVDPSGRFYDMLRERLTNESDKDAYTLFHNESAVEVTGNGDKEILRIKGRSSSKKSQILITMRKQGLSEFLKMDDNLSFDCIMSLQSFQFIESPKVLFPALIEKLNSYGMVVIGETSSQDSWMCVPPPPVFDPDKIDEKYRLWFDVWHHWHKVLNDIGVSRRSRLFPPHDLGIIIKTLEELGFEQNNTIDSEYTWQKTVTSDCFGQVKKLIKERKWKNTLSSLYLDPDQVDDKQLNKIFNDLCPQGNSDTSWNKALTEGLTFKDGVRLHVLRKTTSDIDKEKCEKVLQELIIKDSRRILEYQGLFERENRDDKHAQYRAVQDLSISLAEQIEINNGCYVISMTVPSDDSAEKTSASVACLAGSLFPVSSRNMATVNGKKCSHAKEFFSGFNLPENLLTPERLPRIWLWLYMLYLAFAKKSSETSGKLQKLFSLSPSFNIVADMDSKTEKIEVVDCSHIEIALRADRFNALKEKIGSLLIQHAEKQMKEVAEWTDDSTCIKAMKEYWETEEDESSYNNPLFQAAKKGVAIPYAFYPKRKASFSEKTKIKLFGKTLFSKLYDQITTLFSTWQKDSDIYNDLRQLLSLDLKKEDDLKKLKETWTEIFAQMYLFCIHVYEKDLRYILHVSGSFTSSDKIWCAFQIFLSGDEFSFFEAENSSILDRKKFDNFILPFEFLQLQKAVRGEVKEAARQKQGEVQLASQAHEINKVVGIINSPFVKISPFILDEIVQYFNTIFALKFDSSNLPRNFAKGDTLMEFVKNAMTSASRVRVLVQNASNVGTLFQKETFNGEAEEITKRLNCSEIFDTLKITHHDRLKSVQFCRALICAFFNTLEHARPSSEIKTLLDDDYNVLKITNESEDRPDHLMDRGKRMSTWKSLKYYVEEYGRNPKLVKIKLIDPNSDDKNYHITTILPIPDDFIQAKQCSKTEINNCTESMMEEVK